MDNLDRLMTYVSMAEATRKWVSVMDAKAGFLATLNAATLTFIWSVAKPGDAQGWGDFLALFATVLVLLSLFLALKVVLPRTKLQHAFGQSVEYTSNYEPVSYFGFVATTYPSERHADFLSRVDGLDELAFAREALEQHYTTCHVVQKKASGVAYAGWTWMFAIVLVVVGLLVRG